MAIAQQLVGTSPTTIYTSTGETATTAVFFMNDDAGAVTIQVYLVPDGGSAGTSTQVIKDLSIDPADTYILQQEKLLLSDGDTIQVTADTLNSIYATTVYVSV